jgi:hypothetical protein
MFYIYFIRIKCKWVYAFIKAFTDYDSKVVNREGIRRGCGGRRTTGLSARSRCAERGCKNFIDKSGGREK